MSAGYQIMPYTISYPELEEVIKPHFFSIRETPEPLELHYCGHMVKRFASKQSLIDYLNIKLKGRMAA